MLFVQAETWKRANKVECRWYSTKSYLEQGAYIRALVRLARKLHIFLPLWLLAMGRDEETERERQRGSEKK